MHRALVYLSLLALCYVHLVTAPAAPHKPKGQCSPQEKKGMPLFGVGGSIDQLADVDGKFRLKLFEPRYLLMARAIENEDRSFAFVHGDMSEEGSPGYIVEVLDFEWVKNQKGQELCLIECIKRKPFRIKRSWHSEGEKGLMRGDLNVLSTHTLKFAAGQVIKHKKYKYRGVILSADAVCMAETHWVNRYYDGMGDERIDQPFYYVLPDERDRDGGHTTYVQESNIVIAKPDTDDFQHRLRDRVLLNYNGSTGRYNVRLG